MPVPTQCQSFVDEVEKLDGQIEDLSGLVGDAKWTAAASNLKIRQQIAQLNGKLNACILAFGAGYSTEVVVVDLTPGGGGVGLPLEAMLWRLSSGPVLAVENRQVQSGKLSFANGPTASTGHSLAISVDEAPNATFTGPLFRSNPFPTLPQGSPGNATGAITIFVPGPIFVSAATLAGAVPLSAIPPIPGFIVTAISPVPGVPGPGMISVGITGLMLGVPLAYTYVFGLTPSRSITSVTTTIVDVVPSPGTISSVAMGAFGGIAFSTLMSTIEPLIRAAVTPAVATAINGAIVAAAVTFLGRPLTPFETISLRRIVITSAGASFFPTFCTYGP